MSKIDNKKVAKRAREAYNWTTDVNPSKRTKREKTKERQDGKKQIRKEIDGKV